MTQTRARDNHYKANATVWEMGLARCWKIKAPAWRVNKVTWSIE